VTPQVYVTGMGVVSALGVGRDAHQEAARSGSNGIRLMESVDISLVDCKIAGEVPARSLPPFDVRRADRFVRFALLAAQEAGAEAGLSRTDFDPRRLGVVVATGLGGCETLDAAYHRLYAQNLTRFHPTSIPYAMYNAATSAVANQHQAKGPAYSVVSACASGAHAITQGLDWIRSGRADMVLAGAADAPLAVGIIRGWEGMRILSVDNENPDQACRPFSADRKGLVLAEGAAILLLESEQSARRRGAAPLGAIAGCGLTSDAGHLTDPSTEGAQAAMELALTDGRLQASEIDYVNAHGTGTRANDSTETNAIKAALGGRAYAIPVSSTKSMHGHAMGASGAIEIVLSLIALNAGVVPPTRNLHQPDPQCDLDYVPNTSRPSDARVFLSNSFGFGGLNGVVAVRTQRGL